MGDVRTRALLLAQRLRQNIDHDGDCPGWGHDNCSAEGCEVVIEGETVDPAECGWDACTCGLSSAQDMADGLVAALAPVVR